MATIDAGRERAVRDGLAAFSLAGLPGDVDVPMRKLYVRGLKEFTEDIIRDGAERLLTQPGRKFFPTLPEWSGMCEAVIEARRKALAVKAFQIREMCPDCRGSGWRDAEGPNAVESCSCVKRALQVMEGAPERPERLALPTGDLER